MNQQVVYQDISQIHPYENNPRNNEAAVGPVAQSIKEFGFRVPILIDGKGTIIAGHTRYEAAKRLGMDKVPCILVDDLTDAQIKAYRIADNKVAEASSWNDDVLRAEMDALQALDVDLSSTGFSEVELACSGMWTIPILRSFSQSLSNSRPKRPIQTRAPKASNLDSLHPFSPLRRNRAALNLSNARTAENGLKHEAVFGGNLPVGEDCAGKQAGVRSGELFLYQAVAGRGNAKMEDVSARQRGIHVYARGRGFVKAGGLGRVPKQVYRLHQPPRCAALLRVGRRYHRRL